MNINNDPIVAELQHKARQIADRLEAIAARQRELQQALAGDDTESRLEAALAGRRTEAPEAELAALATDAETLRRARGQLSEQLATARRRASRAIARELAPEHQAAVAGIAAALAQLRQALEAEAAVHRRLAATGADHEVLPTYRMDGIVSAALGRLERAARDYASPTRDAA
jgi:hypothetical protein